jgi:hypothetical protein
MKDILAVISIVGFIIVSVLAFLAAKFGIDWAKAMMDTILPMIVQCWIINFTTVMNFHYGTSSGSAAKNAVIAKLTGTADQPIDLNNPVK